MAPRKAKDAIPIAPAPAAVDHEDLMRKRDSFVTSMTMLRNAADEASRAGLAYFDLVTHGVSAGGINGDNFANFVRAMSAPPGRAQTEEPDAGGENKRKRKRNVKPKDPNAPKKPATPFFLFCSEGRATVKSDMGDGVEFKDVQQELRRRWEILPQEDKQAWSDLYQVKLAEWKKVNEAYLSHKIDADTADLAGASTEGLPVPVLQVETTVPTGGFTAVNHSKLSHEIVEDSDDEIEDAPEVEEEPEVEEPAEEEVTELARMQEVSSDSSLTPPPAEPEKPKATPRGRKPRSTPAKVAVAEVPTPEKKPRKSRTKKVKDAEPASEESPKKRGRKKRKSGLE